MIEQLLILITTVPATFMTQSKNIELRKWACIVGLIGEPFWFYSAWRTGSWGVGLTAVAITIVWIIGYRNHWMKLSPQEIRFLGDFQRIRTKPGDRFVIMARDRLTAEQCRRIGEYWKTFVPGHDVAVLDNGMRVVAITPVADELPERD